MQRNATQHNATQRNAMQLSACLSVCLPVCLSVCLCMCVCVVPSGKARASCRSGSRTPEAAWIAHVHGFVQTQTWSQKMDLSSVSPKSQPQSLGLQPFQNTAQLIQALSFCPTQPARGCLNHSLKVSDCKVFGSLWTSIGWLKCFPKDTCWRLPGKSTPCKLWLNERPKINFLSAERVHSHQCHCGLCTAPWHASCLVPFTHSTSLDQNSLDKCYPLSKRLEVVGLEPRLYKGAICVQKSSPHLQTFVCCAWKKNYHAIRNQRLSRMTWNTHLPKMR